MLGKLQGTTKDNTSTLEKVASPNNSRGGAYTGQSRRRTGT